MNWLPKEDRMICGGELVFCFQITTVQNELTTRPVSRLAIDLNSPAKINLTCRIQLIAKPPHICRIQSIAEFNSTQRKCGVLFTSSVIRINVKEQTKSVLLREFLPSLKGQHRWQKPAIKHCRNVPAFSSFSRQDGSLLRQAKFVRKMTKYLIPANTFGWKTHKVVGRACRRLSLTYWLDSRRSWTFRPSAAAC